MEGRPGLRTACLGALCCALVVPLLLAAGCASAPTTSTVPPRSTYLASRDSLLYYRLPTGWIDATADSQASDRVVWLVRDDYAGSLAVREIHVDGVARRAMGETGLMHLAQLTAALETGSKPAVLTGEPERGNTNGREEVSYEVEYSGTGDKVRTVLLDTGERVYAVSALVNGGAPPTAGKEIFTTLRSFLSVLRW